MKHQMSDVKDGTTYAPFINCQQSRIANLIPPTTNEIINLFLYLTS
jgi:hypothetical protein